MSAETPTDAEAFLLFLADELRTGGADKSPEEMLQMWRATHAEVVEDIRQGIRDFEAGCYRPFEEVDAAIRKKFGFASKKA